MLWTRDDRQFSLDQPIIREIDAQIISCNVTDVNLKLFESSLEIPETASYYHGIRRMAKITMGPSIAVSLFTLYNIFI